MGHAQKKDVRQLAIALIAGGMMGAWINSMTNKAVTAQAVTAQAPPARPDHWAKMKDCATEARIAFKAGGWEKLALASFTNHYSQKLNRCFVLVNSFSSGIHSKTLLDAFEGSEYGEWMQEINRSKPNWRESFSCHVGDPSSEQKACASEVEFNQLAKPYLEDSQPIDLSRFDLPARKP